MRGKSAVDLARDLLTHFGSLGSLFAASEQDFSAIPGMGPAKYVQLQAVLEMARRTLHEELRAGDALTTPATVRDYLRLKLGREMREMFLVVFLDAQHRVIETEVLFQGTLTQTSVYPREVVVRALHHNAAAVLLAHNHPSGSQEPSAADRQLTSALSQVLSMVDVRVLDHFIVTRSGIASFAESGWL